MNDDNRKQKLNDLVSSYQQTKAPPGFAQRVTANLEQEKPRTAGFPRFALAASIGAIAIVSLVIVQSIDNIEPEIEPNIQLAKTETAAEQETKEAKDNDTSSTNISAEEMNRFFSPEFETDDSSLAVLTDISDWLAAQQELESPDISDLPAMSDINALFETG